MVERKLKAYFVDGSWERGHGFAVIASTAKEAKKRVYGIEGLDMNSWIELHVKWIKNANIEGCKAGQTFETEEEALDAMFRGIYGALDHIKCPRCGTDDIYVYELYDNVWCCNNCEEGLTKEDINNPYVKKKEDVS